MTREEARARALAMPRLAALVDFRNNVVDTDWRGLDILLPGGNKAAIGNPTAIAIAKKALLDELDRQIASA